MRPPFRSQSQSKCRQPSLRRACHRPRNIYCLDMVRTVSTKTYGGHPCPERNRRSGISAGDAIQSRSPLSTFSPQRLNGPCNGPPLRQLKRLGDFVEREGSCSDVLLCKTSLGACIRTPSAHHPPRASTNIICCSCQWYSILAPPQPRLHSTHSQSPWIINPGLRRNENTTSSRPPKSPTSIRSIIPRPSQRPVVGSLTFLLFGLTLPTLLVPTCVRPGLSRTLSTPTPTTTRRPSMRGPATQMCSSPSTSAMSIVARRSIPVGTTCRGLTGVQATSHRYLAAKNDNILAQVTPPRRSGQIHAGDKVWLKGDPHTRSTTMGWRKQHCKNPRAHSGLT